MKNKNKKPPSSQKVMEVWFEDEDGCDMDDNAKLTSANMNRYFRILCQKKGAVREEALIFIVEAFTKKPGSFNKFLDKNFLMLLSCCLSVIGEGSADEIQLASSVIGLLAMIVASQHRIREIYGQSIPAFSQALESKLKAWNVVDSLAIMTIFTADNALETEEVMKMIWNLIEPKPTVCSASATMEFPNGHLPSFVATAISAWSFLLSSIDGWQLSGKYWQSVIPCLLSLLNTDNEAVAIAASETLELVCGLDSLEKFSTEADSINVQEIKQKTDKHLGGKPKKENIVVSVGNRNITLSAWSQVLQLNFIERFLGEGLTKHMMENQNFRRIFKFPPQRRNHIARTLYLPEREEGTVKFFLPELGCLSTPDDDPFSPFTVSTPEREEATVSLFLPELRGLSTPSDDPFSPFAVMNADRQLFKRITKAQFSSFSKAKTILRSKQRASSKESDLFAIMDQN